MVRLGIFASGEGSNAQNFINYFRNRKDVTISLIVSTKKEAGVIQKAIDEQIPDLILDKESFYNTDLVLNELKAKVDFIVLAGFLWMIPPNIIKAYEGKMVNIHPALLPKYGGKGMFGKKVHEAVIHNKEKESGMTIHYVNENYDEGKIIFQGKCVVEPSDTPEALEKKIHELEYEFYPKVVEEILQKQ